MPHAVETILVLGLVVVVVTTAVRFCGGW